MSRLLTIKGQNRGVSYILGDRTRIGRLGESEIQVADPNVSRIHAEIVRQGEQFSIFDRGSKNGIEVNGQAVAEHKLAPGDLITIGSATLLYDGLLHIQNARLSCSPVVTLSGPLDNAKTQKLKTTKDTSPSCTAEITSQLTRQPASRQKILSQLSHSLASCMNATYVVILVQDYPDGPLSPIDAAPRNRHAYVSTQLLEQCIQTNQVQAGTASLNWQTLDPLLDLTSDEPKPDTTSLLIAPINGQPGTRGAIIIGTHGEREYTQADAAALQTIAAITSLALQHLGYDPNTNNSADIEQTTFATRSLRIQEIYNSARRAGPGNAPILITGEIGSGKETLARFIHNVCERVHGPFIVVQCSGIPTEEMEKILFGTEVVTEDGEITVQPGKIDEAAGGTLFLEEVGDLELGFQPKLLRFIQDHAYTRVGSHCAAMADVKVIASSSKDLAAAVRSGNFREDLWYRLNVVPFHMPPLRERREDIAPLLDIFVHEFSARYNRSIIGANDTTINLLQKYDWPGNIRELRNAVERAVLLAESKVLSTSDFSHIEDARRQLNAKSDLERKRDTRPLAEVERQHIIIALKKHQFNQARAAEGLGLHRNTLRNKIIEYGIEIPK